MGKTVSELQILLPHSGRVTRVPNRVNLVVRNRVFRTVLLAAGVLLIAACASPSVSTPDTAAPAATPLLEKKFQIAATHYEKFQHEGQTLYCKRVGTRSMGYSCLSEPQLRREVESFERWRNPVVRGRTP